MVEMTEIAERDEVAVLSITPTAVAKLHELLQARSIPNHGLRVFVAGGGCSGMQYGMAFEESAQDYDTVVETEGVRLFVDPTSAMYIGGATIDFVDSLMGGGFRIDNPNAVSSCGCGNSFRTSGESSAEQSSGDSCGCGSCSN